MQQHSQIVELKDRLHKAIDEQYNVKNTKEVSRVISELERLRVTREDLEKTRLGKTINELRRKTADKELAKSAKKLIKSWQKLMDSNRAGAHVNAHSNTTTPNASLTSPLKPRSVISPYGASNDSLSCSNSSYAPSQSLVNGKAAPASANNGNGHPALMRLKNQHTDKSFSGQRVVSPSSASLPASGLKANASTFRPQSKTTASPSLVNGAGGRSVVNGSKLTSPVIASSASLHGNSLSAKNGLSPGTRHSFKNILGKDGISPNANALRRRTTPPTPNSSNSSVSTPLGSSIINADSAPSSRHASPALAFAFSNDSRDSFHNHRNAYSHHPDSFSPPDTNDEDSNSSVFSSNSIEGMAHGRSLLGGSSGPDMTKKHQRKRKRESGETDSLRENLNSLMNSGAGRRLQTTQELAEKFNIKIKPSLSASSSPHLHIGRDDVLSPAKRAKLTHNGAYKNGFHHDESLLGEFESSAKAHQSHQLYRNNKSLPASPALLSGRNTNATHSATTSPAVQSHQAQEELTLVAEEKERRKHSKSKDKSDESGESRRKSRKQAFGRSITEVDRDIEQIYAQLPEVNPEDLAWLEQFKFDTDDPTTVKEEEDETFIEERQPSSDAAPKSEPESNVQVEDDDEDEYELFEYNEEYEELEDEEVEVTDADDDDEDEEDVKIDTVSTVPDGTLENGLPRRQTETFNCDEDSCSSHRQTLGDIIQCDKSTDPVEDDSSPSRPAHGEAELKSSQERDGQQPVEPDHAIASSTSDFAKVQEPDSTTSDNGTADDADDHCVSSSLKSVALVSSAPSDAQMEATSAAVPYASISLQPPSFPELDPLESLCSGMHFFADMEMLDSSCYTDPNGLFYSQFPPSPPPSTESALAPVSKECNAIALEASTVPITSQASAPMNVPMESSSQMETSTRRTVPSPAQLTDSSNSSDDFDDDEEEEEEQSQGDTSMQSVNENEAPASAKAEVAAPKRRKRTKKVIRPVLKKKYRKCVTRSKVKRAIVDRINEDYWENVNGNFDKDGNWHDFAEMTSAYVLTGGQNATNTEEDNVLHILPYVNLTW